jgi:hypothetical protein
VTHVLLQDDREVAEANQAAGTPTGVLIRPDGTIGSPLAPGGEAIAALVAQTVGQPTALPALLAPTNGRSPAGGPQLLAVSAGTVEANQALGLRSPVVLDQGFSAGRAFGATGTPSAVLVDAQGHMASSVAVGAAAVLALAAGADVPSRSDNHAG